MQKGGRSLVKPEGYIGLGPETMRVGNMVAVLRGASVPVVFEPDATNVSGQGSFGYVGRAYCYVIMDGELVEMMSRRDLHCMSCRAFSSSSDLPTPLYFHHS